jgi:hypothetical protein
MKRAFHVVALHEAITQLGVAMGAQVVNGKHFTVNAKEGNVLALGSHGDACAFKQIGLGGHVSPVAHCFLSLCFFVGACLLAIS